MNIDPAPGARSRTAAGPAGAPESRVAALRQHGQSVWLDELRRGLIEVGELARLVATDGLAGVTSNPAIFQKAIEGSADYAGAIDTLARRVELGPKQVFEQLAIADIQAAADVLGSVYRETGGIDGYVSLEVAPDLAGDTRGSIEEGKRLWHAVQRPNLMIKVPATPAGLPAIRALLEDGVNVNITLLFARQSYEQVAQIYIEALEARLTRGENIHGVASVASFFVSRIDAAVDARLEQALAQGGERARLEALRGKVAIANAKLAYQSFQRLFSGPRWEALAARGAMPQRVLWASTGTKNKSYSDVLYVEELIGPHTVNTMPPETLAAFQDHGRAERSLDRSLTEAQHTLDELERVGISLDAVTNELVTDGVAKFMQPYTRLLAAIEAQLRQRRS